MKDLGEAVLWTMGLAINYVDMEQTYVVRTEFEDKEVAHEE